MVRILQSLILHGTGTESLGKVQDLQYLFDIRPHPLHRPGAVPGRARQHALGGLPRPGRAASHLVAKKSAANGVVSVLIQLAHLPRHGRHEVLPAGLGRGSEQAQGGGGGPQGFHAPPVAHVGVGTLKPDTS